MKSKWKLLTRIFIWLILILMYAPILFIVIYSFDSSKYINIDSFNFSFELYVKLFKNEKTMAAVVNTLVIALSASIIAVVLGTITAVGFHALRKIPKNIVNALVQIPIVNADIVTAVSLMLFFVAISIPKSYLTVILAHSVICTPYVVLSVLPRLQQLNPNLYEAAQDLGATPIQALTKVLIPQLISGMISGFALAFTLSLDDFVITQFTKSDSINTISTLVYSAKTMQAEHRALSALIFLLVIAILIVVNFKTFSKQRKKGESK